MAFSIVNQPATGVATFYLHLGTDEILTILDRGLSENGVSETQVVQSMFNGETHALRYTVFRQSPNMFVAGERFISLTLSIPLFLHRNGVKNTFPQMIKPI